MLTSFPPQCPFVQERTSATGRPMVQKSKSVTMEYFIESRNLDDETANILKQYDADGNGSFSKDEVVSIILDLREQRRSNEILLLTNRLFKKLLIAASIFCVLLLAGMFGLSFAVAALTANTEVASDGTLLSNDGSGAYIATDSAASVYEVPKIDDIHCIPVEEAEILKDQVLTGRNVIVQLDDFDAEGHTFVETLNPSGADIDKATGGICFQAPELGVNQTLCLIPDYSCDTPGRRLSTDAPSGTETPSGATHSSWSVPDSSSDD